MRHKRQRRLPYGEITLDKNVYLQVWGDLVKKAESLFPGYVGVSYNPVIVLEKHRTLPNGTYTTDDRVVLSPEAIAAITCPKCSKETT